MIAQDNDVVNFKEGRASFKIDDIVVLGYHTQQRSCPRCDVQTSLSLSVINKKRKKEEEEKEEEEVNEI